MGKIIILNDTTLLPITKMGEAAGICWGADTSDPKKNYERGLSCLRSNHGRVMEAVNVEMAIIGYSAKVIREWYTHIGCLPTRLQASTRRINYKDFGFVTPKSILQNAAALKIYADCNNHIKQAITELESMGIPREDASYLLPLGMETAMYDKRNLRNLIDMSHQRECSNALWEYREMFGKVKAGLSSLSDEWQYVVDHYFKPKCELTGYCTEEKSCHRKPKKEELNAQA